MSDLEERRVRTIAAQLVEQIRPLVEGRIDPRFVAHTVAQDCDRWKRLPLGAQIIRCVGRAYRHAGRDFLHHYKSRNWNDKNILHHLQTDLAIGFRQSWRNAKNFFTAAAASGRLAMTERLWKKTQNHTTSVSMNKPKMEPIEYQEYDHDDHDNDDSFLPDLLCLDDTFLSHIEEEQKLRVKEQAQQTLIQALQVEALWKASKIDLDRIVQRACSLILSGEYFFFPSHQSPEQTQYHLGGSGSSAGNCGWVSSSGKTIHAEQARIVAAEALVMIGEVMVQQSKVGTSWKA
jgi:hypothetical protein